MKKFWLIFLLPLILISCPKEELGPEEQDPEMAEAQIGPAGGILEAQGIIITVPPGAFSTTQTVQISLDEEFASDFEGNAASPVFSITGIPSNYNGNVMLAIRYNVALENESYLAVGEFNEMFETEGEAISYALYETKDSSGYLVAKIPSPEEEPEEEASKGSGLKSASSSGPFKILAQALYRMAEVDGSYFSFVCPQQNVREKILQLAGYMDDAMQEYFRMKLADQTVMDEMIKKYGKPQVVVTNLVETAFNDYIVKMPPLAPCALEEDGRVPLERYYRLLKIKTNLSRTSVEMASAEDLKSFGYLLAYRMISYAYFGDVMDWFAYASAVWISEKYSGVSHYDLSSFSFSGKSPFLGMEAGKNSYPWGAAVDSYLGGKILRHEGSHALGMYPFVKYLDTRYPDDQELYLRIWREILWSESKTSMEGIINALKEPVYQWWPGFFEKYLTRQLVDVPAEEFLKLFPGVEYQVDFFYEKDTSRFNEAAYADLSARLYKVSFLFPSFEKEATLNLKATPSSQNWEYVTAMAFGLKEKQLEYFDQAADLTIAKLKALTDNDFSSIPVAVVNSSHGPSIDETIDIELKSTLKTTPDAPADFFQVAVEVTARANYTDNAGSTSEDDYTYASSVHEGNVIDHTFTASWSDPGEYYISSGTIEIEFDPDRYPEYITRYSFTETHDYPNTSYSHTYTVTGENLEFRGYKTDLFDAPLYYYYAYDEDACNYITTLDYQNRDQEGEITLYTEGAPVCDDQTFFWIKLYYEVD